MRKIILLLLFPTLFFFSCIKEKNINVEDYPLLLTVDDISNNFFVDIDISSGQESCELNKYFDGSMELEYEFESSDEHEPFWMMVIIDDERKVSDAMEVFSIRTASLRGALKFKGLPLEEMDNSSLVFYSRSTANIILSEDGFPVGNLLIVRADKLVYTVAVVGVYFDDITPLNEIIEPKIKGHHKL